MKPDVAPTTGWLDLRNAALAATRRGWPVTPGTYLGTDRRWHCRDNTPTLCPIQDTWADTPVTQGKGRKDRYVPFPDSFKETLALHLDATQTKGATFLFESNWKKPYSTRGVRAMFSRYATKAGLNHHMPPHRLRHFLFTWLKTHGIDDAHIQPYSGHASRTSLEIYSRLALTDAQTSYNGVINEFPV